MGVALAVLRRVDEDLALDAARCAAVAAGSHRPDRGRGLSLWLPTSSVRGRMRKRGARDDEKRRFAQHV